MARQDKKFYDLSEGEQRIKEDNSTFRGRGAVYDAPASVSLAVPDQQIVSE